jgi:hypothetical protein
MWGGGNGRFPNPNDKIYDKFYWDKHQHSAGRQHRGLSSQAFVPTQLVATELRQWESTTATQSDKSK